MARPLRIRKPRAAELRRLHQLLEGPLQSWQRRRIEALLLYAAGLDGQAIAPLLGVHRNTIYADLHAFHQHGLASLQGPRGLGAPARLTQSQIATICRLADQSPTALGLPYGRWSLAKLRAYLLKQRILKAISREHLRRLLEKRGFISAASDAS
jgi:transposase